MQPSTQILQINGQSVLNLATHGDVAAAVKSGGAMRDLQLTWETPAKPRSNAKSEEERRLAGEKAQRLAGLKAERTAKESRGGPPCPSSLPCAEKQAAENERARLKVEEKTRRWWPKPRIQLKERI